MVLLLINSLPVSVLLPRSWVAARQRRLQPTCRMRGGHGCLWRLPKGSLAPGSLPVSVRQLPFTPCVCAMQVAALMMSFSSQPVHCVLSVCSAAAAAEL